jgi:hypothetical protein
MPTVKQLQAALKKRGLETTGRKAELEARLAASDSAAGRPDIPAPHPSAARAGGMPRKQLAVKGGPRPSGAPPVGRPATKAAGGAQRKGAARSGSAQLKQQTGRLMELLLSREDIRSALLRPELFGGVLGLWRLRRISHDWRRWAEEMLATLPRLVALGGTSRSKVFTDEEYDWGGEPGDQWTGPQSTARAEVLDLRTMAWALGSDSSDEDIPAGEDSEEDEDEEEEQEQEQEQEQVKGMAAMAPAAAGALRVPNSRRRRSRFMACQMPDGRIVAAGGFACGTDGFTGATGGVRRAEQWVPGTGAWTDLPKLPDTRWSALAVALADGRVMLIGGFTSDFNQEASVLALSPGADSWAELEPMGQPRVGSCATRLPNNQVLVAGGFTTVDGHQETHKTLDTVEIFDPAENSWSALPSMPTACQFASCCVLPSGRVAVFGGSAATSGPNHQEALLAHLEVYTPTSQTWETLPSTSLVPQTSGCAVAVLGGLIVVGCGVSQQASNEDGSVYEDEFPSQCQLFDEATGRWYTLPHEMNFPRTAMQVVAVPRFGEQLPMATGDAMRDALMAVKQEIQGD